MAWIDLADLVHLDPPSKREIMQVIDYRRRKAKARFYADENFPTKAVELLRRMGAHVTTVQEARRRQHPDENHAAFALKEGLMLLTLDRDYLDERRHPLIHCPAIAVFNFGNGSREEIEDAVICLKRVFGSPQFFDKWVKIDANRESWIEYTRHLNGTTSRSRYRVRKGKIQEWVE